MFSGRPKAYSLEDGALHLQFRGRAFGATGRFATGKLLALARRNLIKSIITLLPAHHKVLRIQLPPLAFTSLR